MTDREVLIKLKRKYSKDDTVAGLSNIITELYKENNHLKQINNNLKTGIFERKEQTKLEKKLEKCVQRYEIITKIKREDVLNNQHMKKKHNISFV